MSRTPNMNFVNNGVVYNVSPRKLEAALKQAAETGVFECPDAKEIGTISLTVPNDKDAATALLSTLFPPKAEVTALRPTAPQFEDLTDAEDITPALRAF
jgi:hypothetical protein